MDVGGWLRGLGLGHYEEKFRDNKIDADLLPRLTVDDLKDIGVSVVGDRRRLLDAIAVIAGAGRPADLPASPTKSAPSKGLQASAERRPITVMFCDLVGSTSLAAKLDAEDWRNLVNAYLDQASAAVTDFGGHVLKKLGDGLMALFGYPHAQENDAERAVRAALAIQHALVDRNARNIRSGAPELSARIGIECGSVVVDAAGEVFGEAPNVAARVQAAAEPGSVLVTGSVQRQVAGLFVVEEKGAHELKGVAQPLSLYRVVRASGGGRRGGMRALTQFVGREEELDLLTRRWDRARQGAGQLALIVGEPGLGKSRLMEEFHGRLGETPHTWTEWSSSQLLQNTPLHPIAEWGRQRFAADLPAEQRLADLENTLELIGLDPTEYAPLLAPLVDVPLPEDRVAKLAPEELRRRQLAAMTAWILAAARTQAIVLAFEDLHWADPTSLDLIRALAERGAQASLLIIATTRPEFRTPWSVRSHHSVISLSPLDRVQVAKMVDELSAHHALSRDIVEGVSERTGGVPLFVEEVTRLLLERGEQGGAQAIPPTLQQSLAARLDRLGAARETAQIGAVLGRGFSYALLQSVAGLDEGALQSALERLAQADILFIEGDGPQANYRFKHALIQDAAYDSLLKSRRQALHARAAEILRESASPEPEAIAHHFTQAGLDDTAIEWWGKAGDQALRRSAFQEAIAHLGKAIEMADRAGATARSAPGGSAAPNQRLTQLHVARANALWAARGVGAPETTEAFARARELAYGDKDAPDRLPSDFGLWASSYIRGELPEMRAHAAAFLRDVEASPDSPEASVAHRTAGITCWFVGDYREARDHLERALALFRPGRDDDLAFRFGQDPGVVAMANLAAASWPLGEVDRAISLIDRMKTRVAGLTHISTLASGKLYAAMFELMRGDHLRATPNALELVRLTGEQELPMFRAYGVFLKGWTSAASGASDSGLEDMRRGVEQLREQNVLFFDGLLKIALAEAEARAGDPDRAVAILDEALATADRLGYRAFEAELHRARGDALLMRDPPDPAPAEDAFLTAIATAKQQATRTFELRAALALARLYELTGRPVEAHGVLAPALEGFAPTSAMPQIAEAQALLVALAETDEVKAETLRRARLAQLQVAYGNALFAARGYGAPETTEAFARAGELASGPKDEPERLAADYGLWVGSFARGELGAMRELSATMLRDCERRPRSGEASVAHRMRGVTHWFAGEFIAARGHLEQAAAIFVPERDGDLAFRFGLDPGIVATAYLAQVLWLLGEVELAGQRMKETTARAAKSRHVTTNAYGFFMAAQFELFRRNPDSAAPFVKSLIEVANEHQLAFWMTYSGWFGGWLEWRTGNRDAGLSRMRDTAARQAEKSIIPATTFFETTLAEAEAGADETDAAFCTINRALAVSERTGLCWYEAETHRIRGEILLKRDPGDASPAEEAFLTAIAVAQAQKARSFELRAALTLAKLYQSTARPVDAHAVLATALQGFVATPQMNEIGEGQALLAALVATDEVRAQVAQRHRLTQLQVSYGNALIAARGFAAPETTEAFARARELASSDEDAPGRLAADYGLWVGSYVRFELPSMKTHATAFLRDVASRPDSPEAGVAHRAAGVTCWFAGEYVEARDHFERALSLFQPGRDDDLAFRFGQDAGVAAMVFLAIVSWPLGNVRRAISLVEDAHERIASVAHVQTHAYAKYHAAWFELMRGDRARAAENASEVARLAREHDLPDWRAVGVFLEGLATAERGALGEGLSDMRRSAELLREQNRLFFDGLLKIALAEAEAQGGDSDRALAVLDEALATSDRTGFRAFDAELHRERGEILWKHDPANPAPSEEAFQTAIAVAKQQSTRSFELRATLALAKLYQSTTRPVEAHSVLASALEGFSPTPEMPEIAEAQALLAALEEMDEVKSEVARRRRKTRLHAAYGNAMILAHGYGARETSAAFERARDTATAEDGFERLSAQYGLWAGSFVRGELGAMRELSAAMLSDCQRRPQSGEASIAHRMRGVTHWCAGEFVAARGHLEQAIAIFDPGRDSDLAFRFGQDPGIVATAYLAEVLWLLGEVGLADQRMTEATARAAKSGHAATNAYGFFMATRFELIRRNPDRAATFARSLIKIANEHELPFWMAHSAWFGGWLEWRSGDRKPGLAAMRNSLAAPGRTGQRHDVLRDPTGGGRS